ncbi:MAG: 50S ribosomal protein L44e [Candidatus Marsarchaeota archaeon]|nr:50S ribosomal protein L44e [Candidatus Marsarchaeota archaeon]MCL5418733.1 50S ribosomal protein L44e [Candidatus Marsarchaeota archaeon]
MEMPREITTYCPKCGKHTVHTVKMPSRSPQRTMSKATRRHNRAIKGYVGSVEPKPATKKTGKHQVVLLECKDCHYVVERVVGSRTKKKIELKA